MSKVRISIVAAAVTAFGTFGAIATPAVANHRCGLPPGTVNSICEGAHDIPQIILCKVAPKFCV